MYVVGESKANAAHRECWDLLPWLVNGNLTAPQTERLEAHLAECPACTEELRAQHELRDRLREQVRLSDVVLLAPQTGWQAMQNRLDAEAGETGGSQRPVRMRRRLFFSGVAASVAIAVVAGLSAALVWQSQQRSAERATPRYQTLTTDLSPADSNTQLRVVFSPDVAVSDAAALLRVIPAQIVAGPSEAGVYTVALQNEPVALPELLARLRADGRIVFVEPIVRIEKAQ